MEEVEKISDNYQSYHQSFLHFLTEEKTEFYKTPSYFFLAQNKIFCIQVSELKHESHFAHFNHPFSPYERTRRPE
jgi:hypothetical protein